jgi:hypothetical protein
MHSDDVVGGGVVVGRAAEHLVTNLLLVDLRGVVLQDAGRQINQEVPQPRRSVDVAAGGHAPDQRSSSVDGVDRVTLSHDRNPVSAPIIALGKRIFRSSLRKGLPRQAVENKRGLGGAAFDGEFTC